MLPKVNRLTKKKDFEVVFKNGRTIKNDFLIYKVLKNHLPESRFGFVISKKISQKATVRNKIKRRLREAVYREIKYVKQPVDVIIFTLPKVKEKKFLEIQKVVGDFFKKYI